MRSAMRPPTATLNDAKYEAERANFPITLIDADYLVDLIISNYDNFDMDGCSLVPLRKLYWPL